MHQTHAGPRATAGHGALAEVIGSAGGALFAAAFRLVARARGTRALHPVGVCGLGLLHVPVSANPRSGVALLDDPGPHTCLLRWSRATGRRRGHDVEGLAMRVEGPSGGDLLFASTGTGVVTRHLLTARTPTTHGPVSTLLPLETVRGRLLLLLDPVRSADHPPTAYRLLVAAPGRPWHVRGRLEIVWSERDCRRRHDPVGHPPAGTWTHPLWARLREPSYGASQQIGADPRRAPVTEHE